MTTSEECCFICRECSHPFSSMDALETHVHLIHGSSEDSDIPQQHSPSSSGDSQDDEVPGLSCRHCQASFEEQSQLNIHYTMIHRDKPNYPCVTCGAVFAVKRELSTHARLHSGEQPHKCGECGKEFGTRQLLKKHCMWHTGERNHVCPHCNKAFFQKGHLTQHLMIHSGGRPHQCTLCQKTFIFKFDLNRHMKIHAERGFSCQQCGRSFQRQISLDEHSLKCKGRPRTPMAAPQPLFPLQNPLFSPEHMEKMAANILAQQRALNALLTPAPPAPAPTPLFCVLCSQHFSSQQMFALHMYTTHMHHQQPLLNDIKPLVTDIKPSISPIPDVPAALVPIKTEENPGSVCASSSSISSCASSPQKPSPVAELLPHKCDKCDSHRRRTIDLEMELQAKTDELQRLKETMRAVTGAASKLVTTPEGLLQTRNIFCQLHALLL